MPTEEIEFPSPYHPMFELKLTSRDENCEEFFSWIKYRTFQSQKLLKALKEYRKYPEQFAVEPPVSRSQITSSASFNSCVVLAFGEIIQVNCKYALIYFKTSLHIILNVHTDQY